MPDNFSQIKHSDYFSSLNQNRMADDKVNNVESREVITVTPSKETHLAFNKNSKIEDKLTEYINYEIENEKEESVPNESIKIQDRGLINLGNTCFM